MDSDPNRHHGPHPLGLHLNLTAEYLTGRFGAEPGRAEFQAMLDGIRKYHSHPYTRTLPALNVQHELRPARVLRAGTGTAPHDGSIATMLMIPSLINGAEILDLMEDRSLLRWLCEQNIDARLLDWGDLSVEDAGIHGVDDLFENILLPAITQCAKDSGRPVWLLGYCMGGTLATAAAQLARRHVEGMILLSPPWDFDAGRGDQTLATYIDAMKPHLDAAIATGRIIPADMIQAIFAFVDPGLTVRKFQNFADNADDGTARLFVAVEDWLNHGRPLPADLASDFLSCWYGHNQPAKGVWKVCGKTVRPGRIDLPALIVAPQRDRLVPPASSRLLAEMLPGATLLSPPSGHVGMIAGHNALRDIWQPLRAWLGGQVSPIVRSR